MIFPRLLLIIFLCFLKVSCQPIHRPSVVEGQNSSQTISSDSTEEKRIVSFYKNLEANAMAQVSLYNLDSSVKNAIKVFYFVYAYDTLSDLSREQFIPVLEADIRVIDFKLIGENLCSIYLQPFYKDSIPINSDLISKKFGAMNTMVEFDIKNKSLVNFKTGSLGKINASNLLTIEKQNAASISFNRFVETFGNKLSKKFINVAGYDSLYFKSFEN